LGLGELNPIFFAKFILGLSLNNFNIRFLWALAKHKQNIVVCSNQIGKTVSLAIAHIWKCFYKKGFIGDPEMIEKSHYQTLNLSPQTRQSKQASIYVQEILSSSFNWEIDGKRFVNDCKIPWFFESRNEVLGRTDFSNNSSLYCLSTGEDRGANLSGAQFSFISYDEAPQSYHLQEELGARIFSRTAKYDGGICLVGTPDDLAPSQQYWYHLHRDAKHNSGEWNLLEGTYDENCFISQEKRESFKARLKVADPVRYRQVILGEFVTAATNVFSSDLVHGLWNEKKEATAEQVGREYVEVIDWGVADQGDETVILIGDVTDYKNPEIVFAWNKQGGDPVELMAMAQYLQLTYNDSKMVMDASEMGGTIFKKMLSKSHPIVFGQQNKPDSLTYLKMRLQNNVRGGLTKELNNDIGRIKSYYLPKLETQLGTYKLDDKKIKQDWVMALSMFAWYMEKYRKQIQAKTYPLNLYNIKSS
jgi:hypothetical protein